MKNRNVLTAVLVPAMLLSACVSGGEGQESSAEETSQASETVTETSAQTAPEFTCRIKEDYIRIMKYTGDSPEVVFPDTIEGLPVKEINATVFSDSSVTDITLPSAVENISAKSINNAGHLQNIYVKEGSTNYISENGILLSADGKTLAMYPGGREGEAVIPESVEKIGDNAFYGCKISSVTFPVTVTEIGNSAFESCVNLHEITVPGNIKEISPYAFCGSGLEKVTISEGVESIGTGAFESTKIPELYLPDSVKTTGNYILGSERGAAISAGEPGDGMKSLDKYEKLSYRNETILDSAIRQAGRMADRHDEYYSYRAYLTDVNGDDFPEMLYCHFYKYDGKYTEYPEALYCFNSEDRKWERAVSYGYEYQLMFYRDKEAGKNMQIDICCNNEVAYVLEAEAYYENGRYGGKIGETSLFYPIGFYSDNEGYISMFECGGNFEIYKSDIRMYEEDWENDEQNDFAEFIKSSMDSGRYEFLGEVSLDSLLKEGQEQRGEAEDRLVIWGDLADSPDPDNANFGIFVNRDNASGTDIAEVPDSSAISIGGRIYNEHSTFVYLEDEDINAENFEKISRLPCITSLSLYCDDPEGVIDLTGIEKLENLRYLGIGQGKLRNTELLYDMDIQWLSVSGAANDLSFMENLDSVRVLGVGNSLEKPADFYSAVSGMSSLEYIVESVWDINVTEEQHENIMSLRPDVKFCHYKV